MIYSVFVNSGRHTCVRVAEGRRYTSIIQYEAGSLRVSKIEHEVFKRSWQSLSDYPVQRAAFNYLKSIAASLEVTPEARAYLELLQSAQTEEDFAQIQPKLSLIKERIMTEATQAQATEAKKTTTAKSAAKKAAPAKKPAAKKAAPAKKPAPAKGKPTAKAATKPAKKDAKAKKPGPGRTSPYAGMSIKVTNKDVQAREGTLRFKLRTAVIGCKTADEALKKTINHDGEQVPVTGTVLSNMVKAGIISVK